MKDLKEIKKIIDLEISEFSINEVLKMNLTDYYKVRIQQILNIQD